MLKVSVVINTYNAEKHLERVLDSAKDFDEIVICDMYSIDRTLDIAQKYGCKLVMHDKAEIVEPARAFAISQAKNNWVLVVDADEVIQVGLKKHLEDLIAQNPELAGVYIPRKNYVFGQFARTSYPDYLLRFIKKDKVEWPQTIHAHPKLDGKTSKISKRRKDLAFIHLANESMAIEAFKTNKYTDLEVARKAHKNYGYSSLMFKPAFHFFKLYVFKGGIFDGLPGLIWSVRIAHYKYLAIAKVIESKIKPESYDKELRG